MSPPPSAADTLDDLSSPEIAARVLNEHALFKRASEIFLRRKPDEVGARVLLDAYHYHAGERVVRRPTHDASAQARPLVREPIIRVAHVGSLLASRTDATSSGNGHADHLRVRTHKAGQLRSDAEGLRHTDDAGAI